MKIILAKCYFKVYIPCCKKGNKKFANLSNHERKKLIKENPSYGRIIRRCETEKCLMK
jgi:hypothetical protein